MSKKKTIEEVREAFKKEGYTLLEEVYVNNKTPMLYICPEGHKHTSSLDNFLRGYRCPECAGQVITYKQVKKSFEEEGYVLLSIGYINRKTKLEYIYPQGHENSICWSDWKSDNRCSKRCTSKGEKTIENLLRKKNVKYICQYRFKDCKNLQPLPFDFYLPEHNLAIEYDGEQHLKIGHFMGSEEELKERQRLDNIKTQYCKDNNINLLRIPYWEFKNIENILKQELNLE
jgi:very-short-patch-repair endonuclease